MEYEISTGEVLAGSDTAPRMRRARVPGDPLELFVPGDMATASVPVCVAAGDVLHIGAWNMGQCFELNVHKVILEKSAMPHSDSCGGCPSGDLLSPDPALIKYSKPMTECGAYVIMDEAHSDLRLEGPGCFQLFTGDGCPPPEDLYVEARLASEDQAR